MARTKNAGNGRLDEALATLIQSQAVLNQTQAAFNQTLAALVARMAEIDAQIAETNRLNAERFARIEALLLEHSRILKALPDAIREKIGFKASGS
jgi:hypothetical protein